MLNTLSRNEQAAKEYAEFDRTDPFAYARILSQLQRGNCSFGNADEIINDMKARRA